MNHDEIPRLLGDLPHHSASRDFTGEVLSKLDRPAQPRVPVRRLAAAAALAVLLASAGMWSRAVDERREAERARTLRAEQQAIRKELEELKRLTRNYDPVIEIEGEGVDFVIDMNEENHVRPAKHSLPPV
jgi:hypothetical protein